MDKHEFTLIHSLRRTVQLEIGKNGEITVKAPYGYSRKQAEEFVNRHGDWIKARQPAIIQKDEAYAEADGKGNLTSAAKSVMTALTAKYAEKMGVSAKYVGITSAKKRFGSCTAENGINYSKYLILYPAEAVEYVAVHELAHTRYHDHGKEFYNFIKEIMPDYKTREKLLLPQNASVKNIESNILNAQNFR